MGEKCIVYADSQSCVYAQKLSGQRVNVFSMKEFWGKHNPSINMAEIGFSPGNIFGFTLQKNTKYNYKTGKQSIENFSLVYDLLSGNSIQTFYLGRNTSGYLNNHTIQLRAKSNKNPQLLTIIQGETEIHPLINVAHRGYLRPITDAENNRTPYQISETEIFIPLSGKILKAQSKIIVPHMMELSELGKSMKKKNPKKFEKVRSFF